MNQIVILSIIALIVMVIQNLLLRKLPIKPWYFYLSLFGSLILLVFIWFIEPDARMEERILYSITLLAFILQNIWFSSRANARN